ncbi:putative Late nodulin [Medicago truncatula]|uniref:Nodule Cysteine-Rich (NCR) secreted peptide n=1 Tax=Medicago truncatula TaxID=3880 RepID=A0A072ULH6_MEDTR|nr:Nodule Cysteine-Rich (NCR) secreted peptide [Medicago truncatula]RHN61092.1 putative Late nodulin [Medicago truncatula]
MAEILKFFYIAIIYLSLFLVVFEDKRECDTNFDCQQKFSTQAEDLLWCIRGYCMSIPN